MSPWPGSWPVRRSARPLRSKSRVRPSHRRPRLESLEDRSLLAASPVGGEFLVNTTTSGLQATWWETPRDVASDAQGDYVAVWGSYGQASPGAEGIYAQRFNAAGQKLGSEFLVNNNVADDAEWASVAMDPAGAFVIAWSQANVDGSGYGVFAQRYNSSGTAVGSVFQVNTYTQNDQKDPTVVMDGNGDFLVAWSSFGQVLAGHSDVYGQLYHADGTTNGGEFLVNTDTSGSRFLPRAAMNSAGDFVVTWTSIAADGTTYSIGAQRFNAAGAKQGSEFQVNTTATGNQYNSDVGIDDNGNFVVVWQSIGQDGDGSGVFGQRYAADGSKQGGEFQVNTYTTSNQSFPTVAMAPGGEFVVTWSSSGQDGDGFGVYGQQYTAAGAKDGGEFRINTTTALDQDYSSVAMDSIGDFVVVWTSTNQDGSQLGVFGQRYQVPFNLDIDGNGAADALTDGLLAMRSMFGFSGSALVSGATGSGATRDTAAEIALFLGRGTGNLALDIDGNGKIDALTDGLLIMRYLFGFRGTALTNGAVATDATRATDTAIEAYLASLLPGAAGSSSANAALANQTAAVVQPAAIQSVAIQPTTIQPTTIQSAAIQPAAIQPVATEPETVQPLATQSTQPQQASDPTIADPLTPPTPSPTPTNEPTSEIVAASPSNPLSTPTGGASLPSDEGPAVAASPTLNSRDGLGRPSAR